MIIHINQTDVRKEGEFMLGNKDIMSKNIKRMMKEKGLKAVDICIALDIPKSTFSCWVNGRMYPRIDKIEKMAKLFNCTKSDLVEDDFDAVRQYTLTNQEFYLLSEYRRADDDTKRMVERLLRLTEYAERLKDVYTENEKR